MKKLLFSLIAVLFLINTAYSQLSQNKIEKRYKKTIATIQKMKNISSQNAKFDIIGKICVENWDVDTLGNLVKGSDGVVTIESLSGGRYLLTQEGDFDIDSIPTHITTLAYLNNTTDLGNDASLDSLLVYLSQNGVKFLFSKQINDFKNGNLVKTTNYIDYTSFGIPTGLILSGFTNYYYNNKDFLISEAAYTHSFWDGTTSILDSIFYTNNPKGYAKESLHFQADFNGTLQSIEKHLYKYNGDDKLIKEEIYLNPDDWTLSNRISTTIKSKFSVNLSEETADKGASWTPTSRDSTYFTVDLPLGFPNRTTYEVYKNNAWKIESITINKDCSGTNTNNITNAEFIARFDNNEIVISSEQIITNAKVSLYNINGQQIFNINYQIVPERIFTNNLNAGMYILEIKSDNFKGVKKLMKF